MAFSKPPVENFRAKFTFQLCTMSATAHLHEKNFEAYKTNLPRSEPVVMAVRMRTRIEAARGHASKPPGIKPYNMRTMTDTDLMDTTLDFRHSVSAHAPATVKNCQADGLADRRRVLRLRKPCKPLHRPASGESDLSAAATLTPPEKGAQDLHSPPDCSLRPSDLGLQIRPQGVP